jgi:hypothetical protein
MDSMSTYVGVEPKQYPMIHCSPDVLVEALTSPIDPEIVAALINSDDIRPRGDKLPKA